MSKPTPRDYMLQALQLAELGRYTVSPNPMVGCLIVKNDEIIGQGWHQRAGEAHAEIIALREAANGAEGATMYVTLEPCCHYGKTPPCIDALIAAKVKRIYIACLDPNPLVSGKGVEQLRAAGIEIELGLAEDKAKQLNEMFFHYITTKRPFVIAKWAMSLDGKTITNPGDSRQISNSETQQHTHRTRAQVDAILIGANTAITDNPLLTVRLADNDNKEGHITKQPVRIILSTNSKLPVDLKMFDKKMPGKTIIATTNAMDPARVKIFRDKAIEVIILPQDENNRVDLKKLLEELGKRHITSLLVEGGMKIHESFFEKKLINKVSVYMAPIIIGTLVEKQKIPNLDLVQMGSDFYFTADFKEDKDV